MEHSVVPRAGHLLPNWGGNPHLNLHWNDKATLTQQCTTQYFWSPSLRHAGSCSWLSTLKKRSGEAMCLHCNLSGALCSLITSIQAQQHADHSHWGFIVKRHQTSLWFWKINFKLSSFIVFCSTDIYLKAKCLIKKWCDIVELELCSPAVLTWILTYPNVEDLNDNNAFFSQTINNVGSPFPLSLLTTRWRGERDRWSDRKFWQPMSTNRDSPPGERLSESAQLYSRG